jgi:predicted transcriptional regulator
MTLVALSHHLADQFPEPDTHQAERLRPTLYHHHLPKLDDIGLVEFDPDEKTVTPTEWVLKPRW